MTRGYVTTHGYIAKKGGVPQFDCGCGVVPGFAQSSKGGIYICMDKNPKPSTSTPGQNIKQSLTNVKENTNIIKTYHYKEYIPDKEARSSSGFTGCRECWVFILGVSKHLSCDFLPGLYVVM